MNKNYLKILCFALLNRVIPSVVKSTVLMLLLTLMGCSCIYAQQQVLSIQLESINTESAFSYTLTNANSNEQLLNKTLNIKSGELVQDSFLTDVTCFELETEIEGLSPSDTIIYKVFLEDSLILSGVVSSGIYSETFNCQKGESCTNPIRLLTGTQSLAPYANAWYLIKPNRNIYYDIVTISDCDTEMWIYPNCDYVSPDDQTGAITYNNDLTDKNAGFSQILLEGEESYYLRVRSNCDDEVLIQLVDLQLKKGCMDPRSCNFDPFANIDSGECIYEDCNPDLIVNQQELISSIRIDSIVNDNDCLVVEGCLSGYGKRDIVRFTTTIENVGDADFIVGEPIEESSLFSSDNCHNHWHYLGYAEYLLFDSTRQALPIGVKNGFCALDYECSSDLSYKYNCDYMGISAGCHDTYESDLLCQWIDITDVPEGIYTLVVRVNYIRSADFFGRLESNFDNNWAQVGIQVIRDSEKVDIALVEDWAPYTDCFGIVYGDAQYDCNGICGGVDHYGDINGDGQVSTEDLDIYWDYISSDYNVSDLSCYDLSDDQKFSLLDYLLLEECLSSNDKLDESSPFHAHCDFPYGVYNAQDTTRFFITDLDESNQSFDLYYESNVDFLSFDLKLSGVQIDSIRFAEDFIDSDSLVYIIQEDRIAIASTTSAYFPKSHDARLMITVYYVGIDGSICLSTGSEVINENFETIVSNTSTSCLEATTTSTSDIPLASAGIQVFPNPSSTTFYIKSTPDVVEMRYAIFDLSGNEVGRSDQIGGNKEIVEVAHALAPGLYFLHIVTLGDHIVQKVIIQ